MKKYWKLVVFISVTCLIIGTFYVKNTTYSNSAPQYTIETITGDEAVANSLTIYGQRYRGMSQMESFRVDKAGTDYLSDETYFTRLQGSYPLQQIETWKKKYRNFMRGKDQYSFFHNQQDELVYVNTTSSSSINWMLDTFDIHVLDKSTKEQQQFQVQIPNYATYWDVDIQYANLTGNELTMLTVNSYDADDETRGTDVARYTFDLTTGKLVGEEVVYQSVMENNEQLYEEVTIRTSDVDEGNIVIVKHQESFTNNDSITSEAFGTAKVDELIHYNIKSNTKKEIAFKAEEIKGNFITFDKDTFYIADTTSSNVRIIPYQFERGVIGDAWEVDVPQPINSLWGNHTIIQENKLYYLNEAYEESQLPTIFVLDLKEEKLDYFGKLVDENSNEVEIDTYFEQLEINE